MNTKSTVQKLNAPKELKKIFEKRPLFFAAQKDCTYALFLCSVN